MRLAVILGSTRTSAPPQILGGRVRLFLERSLARRQREFAEVDVIDPLNVKLPLLEKPHFAFPKGKAPADLDALHDRLACADAYVTVSQPPRRNHPSVPRGMHRLTLPSPVHTPRPPKVTPEYNHTASPALLNVLNHFGSSTFSYKPSAICAYSAGQWGGSRAAIALRPVLSELGCLPVSALVLLPKVQEIIDEAGVPADEQLYGYADRAWTQLAWWAAACKNHREAVDPFAGSPAFTSTPSQRSTGV